MGDNTKNMYYNQIKERMILLEDLEKLLDDNSTIFRYNEKVLKF